METQFEMIAPAARLPRLLAMLNRQAAQHQKLRQTLEDTQRELLATQQRLARVTRLAMHDTLTGLPNRLEFRRRLRNAVDVHCHSAQDFALIYVDLDGFKAINDRHGHAIGDSLLKVVGRRLSGALRAGDSVARHGGDEFICLVRGVRSDAQGQDIAAKLLATISAPCVLLGIKLSVRASMGIAMFPRDGRDIQALIDCADQAMFRVKASARRGESQIASVAGSSRSYSSLTTL